MQRVRIGLTGLAFVFVLVLLAAVFTSQASEEPITANSVDQAIVAGRPAVEASGTGEGQAKEPLAELGVAPGNADTNSAATNGRGSGAPAAR